MGCVTTKKQMSGVQNVQRKSNEKNLRSNKKYGTYTSIEENLMKSRQQMHDQIKQDKSSNKKLDSNENISKQSSLRMKYRMSVQQNKCQMPKINTYQYGPLLIHNPDNIEDADLQRNKDQQRLNNYYPTQKLR